MSGTGAVDTVPVATAPVAAGSGSAALVHGQILPCTTHAISRLVVSATTGRIAGTAPFAVCPPVTDE